jgi:hypothetical protein
MDCSTASEPVDSTRCPAIAFLGDANPEVFRTAETSGVKTFRLEPCRPSAEEHSFNEVRTFEIFRQEDIERVLEGASALVLGLPVPVPSAAIAQERVGDAQSFVVDGLIAAARTRGIRHVAIVSPSVTGPSPFEEVGRIVRSYGMDVLDVPADESTKIGEAVKRWLARCAGSREIKPAAGSFAGEVSRRPGTGRAMRSLQRLPLPKGWDAARLSLAYAAWLGAAFPWLLRTDVKEDGSFHLMSAIAGSSLIELRVVKHLNNPRRRVFLVSGGVLAASDEARNGWMEFRVLPGGKEAIVAVGDFVPRLPWHLYRLTQAPAHQHIMASFAKHLAHLSA